MTERTADAASSANNASRLAELRRLAFSRTSTPEEAERAADAQRILAAEESRPAIAPGPPQPVFTEAPDPDDPDAPYPLDIVEPARFPVSRLTIALVAAAALVVGVVGGVVGTGIASQDSDDSSPAASEPADEKTPVLEPGEASSITGPGDLDAAHRWFRVQQTPSDIPVIPVAPTIDVNTTRLASSTVKYGSVFVARAAATDDLCLLLVNPTGMTSLSCARPEDFSNHGVTLAVLDSSTRGISLRWDGREVIIVVDSL